LRILKVEKAERCGKKEGCAIALPTRNLVAISGLAMLVKDRHPEPIFFA
jgi:hypothetical protein